MSTTSLGPTALSFDPDLARTDQALRWHGTPLAVEHWLESASGFPTGGLGTAPPASPDDVVASSRGFVLRRRVVDEVVAFAEFLAGQAFSPLERAELADDLVDAFTDAPRDAARSLKTLAGGVRRIGGLEPVERAQRRLQALTATHTAEQRRRADGADTNPILDVVNRHNPLLRYWASSGIALTGDAVDARVEQHRLVCGLVGHAAEEAGALTGRLLRRLDEAGLLEIAELAAAEVRLLLIRAWLRDLGDDSLRRLRDDLARALASAFDVDIVVQQVGYRAALSRGTH